MHHYFLGWAKLRFSLGILKGQSLFINLIQIYHIMSTFRLSILKIDFSVLWTVSTTYCYVIDCSTTDNKTNDDWSQSSHWKVLPLPSFTSLAAHWILGFQIPSIVLWWGRSDERSEIGGRKLIKWRSLKEYCFQSTRGSSTSLPTTRRHPEIRGFCLLEVVEDVRPSSVPLI